ncbi:MAG: hypothetical protein M5U07_05170 [Xanthobacteraceae bacterium]|nr:hypothetical protein [Xanthobacteraceae bacterium]
MRLFLGMILGAILITAAAYVHDTMWIAPAGTPAGAEQRPMVNWDVVGNTARSLGTRAREQVDRLGK